MPLVHFLGFSTGLIFPPSRSPCFHPLGNNQRATTPFPLFLLQTSQLSVLFSLLSHSLVAFLSPPKTSSLLPLPIISRLTTSSFPQQQHCHCHCIQPNPLKCFSSGAVLTAAPLPCALHSLTALCTLCTKTHCSALAGNCIFQLQAKRVEPSEKPT